MEVKMKQTKVAKADKAIRELFTLMIKENLETCEYSEFHHLLLAMHEKQLELIEESGIKKGKRFLMSPTTFMFQVARAAGKTPLIKHGANWVSRYIYNAMTLTGLHPCPDVYIRDMRELMERR